MIRGLVDFALNNRWLMVGATIILFAWGAISFHDLPVEAYPDVANNYVQIITQWPGRAAEEVEQQVTIPIEIQMAGIPHLQHLRSTSLAGLSSVMLIFDDESVNKDNRQEAFQRLGQVTLPAGLQPQMGTDWSPVGQIYWYTLRSTNPAYDSMELKSIEDWKLEKEFKSVPGVVDVSSFGGMTREYQIRVDPDKLVAYGLSIGQVEQQIANNNVNAGGNFIEQGEQQVNVREVGLYRNVDDIASTVLKTQSGAALRVKDIATIVQGPKIRLGQIGKTCRFGATPVDESDPTARPDPCVQPVDKNGKPIVIQKEDGKLIDNDDVVEGIVLLQKGDNSDAVLEGIHQKVAELNDHTSFPPASRSFPSSIAATCSTTPRTPSCTTSRRHPAGGHHSVPLPRQCARRHHRRPHHAVRICSSPQSASICATRPPTCSPWARSTSAWWSTAPSS
jgi:cobalt-zinc-cadmium resistance protein CzcA